MLVPLRRQMAALKRCARPVTEGRCPIRAAPAACEVCTMLHSSSLAEADTSVVAKLGGARPDLDGIRPGSIWPEPWRVRQLLPWRGIRLRGAADGESVADIAALVGELRNVAGRSLLHADVEQTQARVQVAVRGRIAAWRETAPAL